MRNPSKSIFRKLFPGALLTSLVLALAPAAEVYGHCGTCGHGKPAEKRKPDIIGTVASAGSFGTLVAAVRAGGLEGALRSKGPFTVFAPTDEAFKKLPKGTVGNLLKPENKDRLTSILTYHVVPGRLFAGDVAKKKSLETVNGKSFAIQAGKDGVFVDGDRVVATDIDTSNGVIHVIENVLIPTEETASAPNAKHHIIAAINKGSALYNSGHHKACADLYVKTGHMLMKMSSASMCPVAMNRLETALNQSERMQCQTSRAWTMRYALDGLLASFRAGMMIETACEGSCPLPVREHVGIRKRKRNPSSQREAQTAKAADSIIASPDSATGNSR